MKITIYNKLRKFDYYITTATRGNYIRSLSTTQVEELKSIGKELGIELQNGHCPKCLLDFIKKLGIPYLEQKDKLEQKKKDKENEN